MEFDFWTPFMAVQAVRRRIPLAGFHFTLKEFKILTFIVRNSRSHTIRQQTRNIFRILSKDHCHSTVDIMCCYYVPSITSNRNASRTVLMSWETGRAFGDRVQTTRMTIMSGPNWAAFLFSHVWLVYSCKYIRSSNSELVTLYVQSNILYMYNVYK
jgi:hypothetical protein